MNVNNLHSSNTPLPVDRPIRVAKYTYDSRLEPGIKKMFACPVRTFLPFLRAAPEHIKFCNSMADKGYTIEQNKWDAYNHTERRNKDGLLDGRKFGFKEVIFTKRGPT